MRALFVTVRMKPEYRDQILKGALEDGRGSREDEPGCLRFDVFQDDSDPNTIYFYEVYRDDAALQAHRAAPHYPAWGNLPAEWFVARILSSSAARCRALGAGTAEHRSSGAKASGGPQAFNPRGGKRVSCALHRQASAPLRTPWRSIARPVA